MPLNREVQLGTSFDWQLQALNPDDSVPTAQFAVTDSLQCRVWQGQSSAPVASPLTVWINAVNATYLISGQIADTANLAPGVYYISVTATRAGVPPAPTRTAALMPEDSTLTLTPVPGSQVARPTYITIADLRKKAPWIEDVQGAFPGSQTGFLDQCADARDWTNECALRNYRGGDISLLGYHGMALDAWYTGGSRKTSLRNPYILFLLQSNMLIVTQRVKDVNTYYALSLICEGLITRGAQYYAMAARYRAQAEQLLASTTLELTVNNSVDGYGNPIPAIPINMSSTNTLWA
jgi:hypothetical protein